MPNLRRMAYFKNSSTYFKAILLPKRVRRDIPLLCLGFWTPVFELWEKQKQRVINNSMHILGKSPWDINVDWREGNEVYWTTSHINYLWLQNSLITTSCLPFPLGDGSLVYIIPYHVMWAGIFISKCEVHLCHSHGFISCKS